ncbi:putative quinol monooxygenase [Pseudactinotalea sp.]|uniref:putative quinol monooxygenase n=1 Tax=Pseudactinotalea sp. TaxID=1926260 RepID=UPI003B3B42AF
MIVVVGHLEVAPANRDRAITLSLDAVRQARATDGCLDFSVSPDPIDPGRINVSERWRDREALETFRGEGTQGELDGLIRGAAVEEFEV